MIVKVYPRKSAFAGHAVMTRYGYIAPSRSVGEIGDLTIINWLSDNVAPCTSAVVGHHLFGETNKPDEVKRWHTVKEALKVAIVRAGGTVEMYDDYMQTARRVVYKQGKGGVWEHFSIDCLLSAWKKTPVERQVVILQDDTLAVQLKLVTS